MEAGGLIRSTDCQLWNSPKFYIFAMGLFFICVTFGVYMHLPLGGCSGYRDYVGLNYFNGFTLVQSYPLSFCIMKGSCKLHSKKHSWTIHGLWPSRKYISNPTYCKTIKFNPKKLNSIKTELGERWPAIDGKDVALWEHEWLKHGTCGLPLAKVNTQLKYFKTALHLHEQYNIKKALDKKGIRPDDLKPLETDVFSKTMKEAFGVDSAIVCQMDDIRNVSIVTEIRICFSKELVLTDCSNFGETSSCEDPIYYPKTDLFEINDLDLDE